MISRSSVIDLNFRPRSYHWGDRLGIKTTSSVKGASRKRLYERSVVHGEELPAALIQHALDEDQRRAWGSAHPWLMGGEYLPDRTKGEVEVARIVIASTTQDVTSVYASEHDGLIHLRVVDEYEGDTLTRKSERVTDRPLTLAELIDFFFGAWDLLECLDMNFCDYGYPRQDVHSFVVEASSDHYPEFGALIRRRIDEWLATMPAAEGKAEND